MDVSQVTADSTRQQFLQLLVTQLQNQDPLQPVKQEDFLSQLAQFSTLEGVEKLNTNFAQLLKLQELTNGASLLGRVAVYESAATPSGLANGVVQAVRVENNNLVLNVDGVSVPIDQVKALATE
ncbi:MAG: flagellar hook capping FlgD N-terminal domain-containing protein [Planctomycetaceae bacterium]